MWIFGDWKMLFGGFALLILGAVIYKVNSRIFVTRVPVFGRLKPLFHTTRILSSSSTTTLNND
jgi:type II secretory pathway component PulF